MDPIKKIDDPRLTAYALGELHGEDAAAVERFLADNPDARAAVDELRVLGDTLSGELANESAPRLSQAQRDAISAQAAADHDAASGATDARVGDPPIAPVTAMRVGRQFAAAAAILLLATASFWILPGLLGDGEEGSFRYDLFGSESESKGEVATDSAYEKPRAKDDASDNWTSGAKLGKVALNGSERETLSASLRRELAELGYMTGDADDALGLPREAARSLPSAPRPTLESEVLGGGVAAGGGSSRGGGPATSSQADEFEQRVLESLGYLSGASKASSAGASSAPTSKPRGSAAPPTNPSGAASGSTGFLTGRGVPNPNAGVVFEEGGAAFSSTSKDIFRDGEDEIRLRPSHAAPRTSGEGYAPLHDNPFVAVAPSNPLTRLSTFGVDVDRASYANVRRFLQRNQLPPADAVRLEELVNAFEYSDPAPAPDSEVPFAVHVSSASAPWAPQHRLVRVALKGRVIEKAQRPPAQLTFLVDVSGSMSNQDKLPLLKQSLRLLVDQLDERDHVALVTYASGSKIVLPSTAASEKAAILAAIDGLSAGGSTHASAGLQLAYQVAEGGDVGDGGTRRVLLCTDGDFNVGVTSQQGLHDLIAEKAKTGTFLTVLGFGSGNYQDVTAETLADRGNGQYAYIDGLDEAHHVFVRQLTGTLVTIAQDVKLQLEFNPAHVRAWRQLGYENRKMAAQDFRNDKKDAGEIGAGHSVVAYYEIVPTGVPMLSGTADLKYETVVPQAPQASADDVSPELLTVNLRWKHPGAKPSDEAAEFSTPFTDGEVPFAQASDDFRFGASVLAFGMALRSSPYAGHWPLSVVSEAARAARGDDPDGQRAEFVNLVLRAQGLLPASVANDRLSPEEIDELRAMGYFGNADR